MKPAFLLHGAIRRRVDADAVPVSTTDAFGWTALHHACAVGWLEGASTLLARGASTHVETADGFSALQLAVTSGNAALVESILAQPGVPDHERNTRVTWNATLRAAERGDVAMIRRLHAAGCVNAKHAAAVLVRALATRGGGSCWVQRPGEDIQFEPMVEEHIRFTGSVTLEQSTRDVLGITGTHPTWSAESYVMEHVDEASPHASSRGAFLPTLLCESGTSDMLQRVVHGEDDSAALPVGLQRMRALGLDDVVAWLADVLPAASLSEPTVLSVVLEDVTRGRVDLLERLLARGMNIDAPLPARGSPMLAAVRAGRRDMVAWLVARGADVNAVVPEGCSGVGLPVTPLGAAVIRLDPDMIADLLERGADANRAADPMRVQTHPLGLLSRGDVMRSQHRPGIMTALLAAGADVNFADGQGRTPLHVERHTDIQALLLEHGADMSRRDADGWTPLMRVMLNSFPVANALITRARAEDLAAVDAEGNTLVHLACFSSWPDKRTFIALKHAGLALDARNHAGLTPAERAALPRQAGMPVGEGQARAVEWLQELAGEPPVKRSARRRPTVRKRR